MKPIKLSMTAFGPFAGQEVIDFKEIARQPVFLICGPTGAGKTTIFDAISYALFGDASGAERKPDGMRSDFATGDILTEVELIFEVKNRRYRIMRQPRQYRLKKSGDGLTEVAAKAELIYTDERGEIFTFTKAAEIAEKMKEIIGLGSEQFKQIMMLPQGEFRKLLTADSKEREAILREIFDAQRYLRFQLQLKEKSDQLEKEIKAIRNIQNQWILQLQAEDSQEKGSLAELLQREEIDRQELFAAVKQQNKQDLSGADAKKQRAEQIGKQINQQKEILFHRQQENERLQELKMIQLKMTELSAQAEVIKNKEEQAEQIQKAIQLKPYAENCQKIESRFREMERAKLEIGQKSEQITLEKNRIEQEYQRSKSLEFRQKEELADRQIQTLQQQIPLLERFLQLKNEYSRLAKTVKLEEQNWSRLIERKKKLQEQIKNEKQILAETENLEEKKVLLEKKQAHYHKVKDIFEKYQLQNKAVEQLRLTGQEILTNLSVAEANYQKAVERVRHNHVMALRSELRAGDTCPVCGGTFCLPADQSEQDGGQANLQVAEEQREKCRQARESFNQKKTEIETKRQALLEQLLQETEVTGYKEMLAYLIKEEQEYAEDESKLVEYRELSEQRKQAADKLKQYETEAESVAAGEEAAKTQYDDKRSLLDQVIGEGKTLKQTILAEYQNALESKGIEGLEEQLSQLEQEKAERRKRAEALEEDYRRILALLAESKAKYETYISQSAELDKQLQEEKTAFDEKQKQAGFPETRFWQKAIESEGQLSALIDEIKIYHEECVKTTDLEKRLLAEVTICQPHDLVGQAEQIEELEEQRQQNSTAVVELLARVKENIRILQELRQMEDKRQHQSTQFSEISIFAKVANGENAKRLTFERYVLAAFLEDVLQMANQRLQKMTGRYSLKRKEEVTHRGRQSGLEIEVFDAFTGKTRSIQTLSGGESFKAALAMALGLSEVVSAYAGGIELDMLFIDEGFGTLDPESLDTAIDCILDLQTRGKIIGIISHVSELKERISAKLEVRQTPKGSYTEYCSGLSADEK
ncbi:SMC family ATPase [Clostridiales bacterium COT073_COT-073]|nr:SMC family ATPase [Clostridiales bacterium COT073_COT-073]